MSRYTELRPFSVAFAKAYRGWMAEHGIAGREIAALLGRNSGYISERASGKRALDTEDVDALAELTQTTGRELLQELAARARGLAAVKPEDALPYIGKVPRADVEQRAAETDDEDV